MSKDEINSPEHYVLWWIEPIDFIESNNLSYFQANIIKYVFRYKHKWGLKDLRKANFFLERLIDKELKNEGTTNTD